MEIKKRIPIALIYLRLLIGPLLIRLSIIKIENYRSWAIIILTVGLLSDILDGIIARRFNISSEKIRRLDSSVDQVFFISIAIATYIQCPDFFLENKIKLSNPIDLIQQ